MSEGKVRIVTAASLFDGHDAAINIMRRIMQSKGAEVIHLGHNRSAREIAEAAIQEDADSIAITSYQGGHIEFFKYMFDLLKERNCSHIKIFGGGGGTILPSEIEELHAYGIAKIYSPDDGRSMGLEGMIEDVINKSSRHNQSTIHNPQSAISTSDWKEIAALITAAENGETLSLKIVKHSPVLGITGSGGAGKSSVTDEIVRRFLKANTEQTVAVISVDPSKKKTGGALLGDRIRMNAISNPRAYMRSLATRESDKALSKHVQEAIQVCKAAGFDFIILESAGVGQSDASIVDFCDVSLYVMTPEYGAASQLEKINMLDYADAIAINKFDKAGALDAHADVCKQYKRNHNLFQSKTEELPVFGTMAAKFNDAGVNALFKFLMNRLNEKCSQDFAWNDKQTASKTSASSETIIPASRTRYLAEIAETIENYDTWADDQSRIASQLYQLSGVMTMIENAPE